MYVCVCVCVLHDAAPLLTFHTSQNELSSELIVWAQVQILHMSCTAKLQYHNQSCSHTHTHTHKQTQTYKCTQRHTRTHTYRSLNLPEVNAFSLGFKPFSSSYQRKNTIGMLYWLLWRHHFRRHHIPSDTFIYLKGYSYSAVSATPVWHTGIEQTLINNCYWSGKMYYMKSVYFQIKLTQCCCLFKLIINFVRMHADMLLS